MILVYCYRLGVCIVVSMPYKLICENLANTFLIHMICIHSQVSLSTCGLIVI